MKANRTLLNMSLAALTGVTLLIQTAPSVAGRLTELLTIKEGTHSVNAVAFSPNGDRIASGGWSNQLKLWNARSAAQTLTASLRGSGYIILALAFSPDGGRIVTGSRGDETQNRTVKVWGTRSGSEALRLQYPPDDFCGSVAYSPDGRWILAGCGSWDDEGKLSNTLRLWDAETGAMTFSVQGYGAPVAFSPDSRRFVSGDFVDAGLRLWNSRRADKGPVLRGPPAVTAAFSPDSSQIVSGNSNGTINLWHARSGTQQLTLQGHTDQVNAVAYSSDGDWIVSGSQDGSIRLWNADTGSPVQTIRRQKSVLSIAFSLQGSRIVSGHGGGLIKLWSLPTQQNDYLTLTGERVNAALAAGAQKKDILLAEASLSALGWMVLYGNDRTSAALARRLNEIVFDAYNGTGKIHLHMEQEHYFEMLNLDRFQGGPVRVSSEYVDITRQRVNEALAPGAEYEEFKLAEGSLCALGWLALHGNDSNSLALAEKLMNAAASAWPGSDELYMVQTSTAYFEMINLDRFKMAK